MGTWQMTVSTLRRPRSWSAGGVVIPATVSMIVKWPITRLRGYPAYPLTRCINRGMRQQQPEEVVEAEELKEVEEAEEG